MNIGDKVFDCLFEFTEAEILSIEDDGNTIIVGEYSNEEGFTMEYERNISEISLEPVSAPRLF